ncbi:helix-turn-helix transcriptional regulator [Winogradskyella ludwigii]|uniref:helix-turn-helix transcriptional regulator n=1 Tax=Winogradskyella ludwigii TaxID=2686076 RepID=UPI0015CDDC6D|nr:WYL domain-containing protein [Winogradskyella ludwigii]
MSNDIRRFIIFLDLLKNNEDLVTSHQIEVAQQKEGLDFSTSTLNRDFSFLVKIGFKIYNDKTKGYKLDLDDIEEFTLLTNLFKRIAFSNVLNKVISLDNKTHKYLALDDTSLVKNFQYFDIILKAIDKRKEISFQHTSFYHTEREISKSHMIKPHLLKEYENRWYIVGETSAGFRVFGLDRIENLKVLTNKSFKNKTKEASEKLYSTVGLNFSDYEPRTIVLRFHNSQKPYLESLKLHHSQKEDLENVLDGFYTINLFVSYNFELRQQILKYGSFVEVLQPKFVREEIKNEIHKAFKTYQQLNIINIETDTF